MHTEVPYSATQLLIDFLNIVVALQLIAAIVLWVWLAVIANLLSFFPGPVYFD